MVKAQPPDKHSALESLASSTAVSEKATAGEMKIPWAPGLSCRKRPLNAFAMLAVKGLHKQETTTPKVCFLRHWCRDEQRALPKRHPLFTTIPSMKKASIQIAVSSSAAFHPVS
jgi:hypothetical protein